ncbi:MAG TPA: TIGR03936 family radical SAM-associated protein [Symbiobacteriaceae bacterium]|jgi:radical SAM-linked protein
MKLRVRVAKQHQAIYFSHLDLLRTLERSLRRAALPLAYTQGFSPHPRVSFAAALATGHSSEGEFIDVELTDDLDPADFVARANRTCPPGLSFVEAREAPEGDSLQSLLNMSEYRMTLSLPAADPEGLAAGVTEFLRREAVEVTKEGKRGAHLVNIRPQVHKLSLEAVLPGPGGDGAVANLRVVLEMGNQGNLKPDDLLTGLQAVSERFRPAELVRAHRLTMYRHNPRTGALEEPWDLVK